MKNYQNLSLHYLEIIFFKGIDSFYKYARIPPSVIVLFENFFALIFGRDHRFECLPDGDFVVREAEVSIHFPILSRGLWLYRKGIQHRVNFLAQTYCLSNLDLRTFDVVVDCGANSGDLIHLFRDFQASFSYYAIEPNPLDQKYLKRNFHDVKVRDLALGNRVGNQSLWVASGRGGSSLVQPTYFEETLDVATLTLDEFVKSEGIVEIDLFKLEAEGFEPEVLEGAVGSLKIIKYVAVDGGYERGVRNEQTFADVSNFLIQNGFIMVDVYFPWCRALFLNSRFNHG